VLFEEAALCQAYNDAERSSSEALSHTSYDSRKEADGADELPRL